MLTVGHCSSCNALIWRTAIQQRKINGVEPDTVILLWPQPSSLYAQTWTPDGHAVGIAYCQTCAPEIGAPGPEGFGAIIGYETAKDRYARWYTDEWGDWLRAHLRDQIGYDDEGATAITMLWECDRAA